MYGQERFRFDVNANLFSSDRHFFPAVQRNLSHNLIDKLSGQKQDLTFGIIWAMRELWSSDAYLFVRLLRFIRRARGNKVVNATQA